MTRSKTLQILDSSQLSEYPELARVVNAACEALEIEDRLPPDIQSLDEQDECETEYVLQTIGQKFEALGQKLEEYSFRYFEHVQKGSQNECS